MTDDLRRLAEAATRRAGGAIEAEAADPWASTGDGLTPNERLSLAHATGIEVGRAEAVTATLERLRAVVEGVKTVYRHEMKRTWDSGNPEAIEGWVYWCDGCGDKWWPCDTETIRTAVLHAIDEEATRA